MPVSSMTGFGQAEGNTPSGTYQIEIRSVNNRFLDIQTHVPRNFSSIDYKIKKYLGTKISRGSVFAVVNLNREDESKVTWNKGALDNYIAILHAIRKEYDLKDEITFSNLLSFSDIIKKDSPDTDESVIWKHIKPILDRALSDFFKARQKEANYILSDLKKVVTVLLKTIDLIEKRAPVRLKNYVESLKKRVKQIINKNVDQSRIALEISLLADKLDISEECTRFRAHLAQISNNFKCDEPVGKKLGFILQELNREANTISSKANDTKISHWSVILKENVEKIREQILNIE